MKRVIIAVFLLSGCAADKVAHTGVGAATYYVDDTCILAAVAGIGKEIIDSRTHRPDPLDAAATYFGCVGIRTLF